MVKLSEIEAAYKDRDYTKGDYLSHQWYCERGITVHHGDTPQSVMMRYIERLETKLDSIEKACKRDALFKKFLDQGFWHAHEVDLIWRYNGEDRRHEADWLKSIFYALKHEREAAR